MAFNNIITYSDFTNKTWYIDTSKDTTQAKLTDVITKYQKIIYKDLFGEALYNYLHDNKTGAVYTTLVAGETVTIDGYKYTWEGLSAMLIPFVYYYYKKDVESLFNTKVDSIHTYINPKGEKRAYIKFKDETPAIDIATQLGLM